jgi:hypothetical protein
MLTVSRGENLTIVATGTLKEDIEEGAEATVEIKYGYVRLPPQKIDICESIRALNKTCPIKKGDIEISTVVKLPDQVPPVSFSCCRDNITEVLTSRRGNTGSKQMRIPKLTI